MLFFNCRNFIVSVTLDIYFFIKHRKASYAEVSMKKSASLDSNDPNIIQCNDINELRVDDHLNELEMRASEIMEDHPIEMGYDYHLSDAEKKEQKILNMIFNGITSGLLIVLVFLAIFVDNFDAWISWVAGIAANSIAFILPALFYVYSTNKRNIWFKLAIASLIVGVVS